MLTVGGEFDGIGLLAYGLHLAGMQHRWLCEVDPWRRSILAKRWPGVPIFDDVRAVGARSAERVDVIAGGFPCKGASTAGKRNGFDHAETVLWREMARTIRELRPRYVLVENVASILSIHDGAVWGEVVGDLVTLGYDITWDCLPAAAVGAPHLRDRAFAVAAYAGGEDQRCDLPGVDRGRPGPDARAGTPAAADADRDAVRSQRKPERGRGDPAIAGGPSEAPTDASVSRRGQDEHGLRPGQPTDATEFAEREPADEALALAGGGDTRSVASGGGGLSVDWGQYEPAVRRWESVNGPAPEPLVCRVDDGGARRVDRSRLSALGDGVQVQVGVIAGAYIAGLERRRLAEGGLADAA